MPFQLCFLQTAEHRFTITECRGAPLISSASLQIESFLLINSAKVSGLGSVSPQHKAPSFPDSRFPHCGPAALQCAENDACLGKKTAVLHPGEIGMIWGLGSGVWGTACKYVPFCPFISCSLLLPKPFSNMKVLMSAQVQENIFECWI